MYLDKDCRGIYSLHNISLEELSFLRSVLSSFRYTKDPEAEQKAFNLLNSLDVQIIRLESGAGVLTEQKEDLYE